LQCRGIDGELGDVIIKSEIHLNGLLLNLARMVLPGADVLDKKLRFTGGKKTQVLTFLILSKTSFN